ncbi:PIR protein [Plasmodium vivax]|uniref:VIR protein n=2 Tax=Plasmodium vivax TaxID=5855 RepID=A0A565A6P9_PLAVI|nr:PIR protein [Plasmodium vivax]
MAKPSSTPVVVSAAELEKSALALKLNTLYEALFPEKEKSKFDEQCNKLDTHDKTYVGVKALCSKFARALEKAAELKDKKEEHKNSCNYLRYWLYDEIGKIKKVERSQKIDSIPFFKDLIDAVNKVNEKIIVGKCTLKFDKNVTLDELIKRNISYIYFKKYNDIKSKSKPENKDECSKHFTYLTNIKSLYDKYYNESDYFSCKNSSSGTSSNRSGTSIQAPARAATSEAKMPGNAKNSSPGGLPENKGVKGATVPPKDKGAKEVTKDTVSVDRSKGLPRPEVEAGVRNSGTGGAALPRPVANLHTKEVLGPASKEIPSKGALAVPSYTSGIRTDTVPVPVVDSAGPSEGVSDKVDPNFYRNIIMAAAILGTIFFLFYYNMSSGLKSRFPKRKRKKKIFEHNYYEEYEKELAKYDSEDRSLASEDDRYYLNYQPERDYDY